MRFPTDYDVIRTATLNKTDLAGGNNKFYQIEAHVSKDKAKYRLFSCYGRVGADGVKEERVPSQNEAALLAAFESLKSEKTGPSKGYREVEMAATKVGSATTRCRARRGTPSCTTSSSSTTSNNTSSSISSSSSRVRGTDRLWEKSK